MAVVLDRQNPTPVYLQLKAVLKDQIEEGVYISNQRLPSERDLCEHYNLSRMTARRALQELIAEGLAYTRAGKGTFVSTLSIINQTVEPGSDLPFCRAELIRSLLSFNSLAVEKIIRQARSIYTQEIIVNELFFETIRRLETLWHHNKIGLLALNYAITTIRSYLISLANGINSFVSGPKILLACTPGDQHEMGLLSLAVNLRQQGFLVTYLGSNTPAMEFHEVMKMIEPRLICFSASTIGAAQSLARISELCHTQLTKFSTGNQPILTFGGAIFCQQPSLVHEIAATYLGNSIQEAAMNIIGQLHTKSLQTQ